MMRRVFWCFLLLAACVTAQESVPDAEQKHLIRALGEAGSSPQEFIRALESHLAQYPTAQDRAKFERALAESAVDIGDENRIIEYGERVLSDDPGDLVIMAEVARSLLSRGDKESAERALKYSRQLEEQMRSFKPNEFLSRRKQFLRREAAEQTRGEALLLQSRASGNLGDFEAALALAEASYDVYPTGEVARQIAEQLLLLERQEEALQHLADAFAIADAENTEAGRASDRRRLGELYRQLKGSETGLGDLMLAAYDRTAGLFEARRFQKRQRYPNADVTDPAQFVLPGLGGSSLDLSSMEGSVLVLDFWATWCRPCLTQHPLYEEVRRVFRDRPEVVFVSVSTDEDQSLVEPFLEKQGWSKSVYFEDGLSELLRVSSIPTTIIINRDGEVASRMNGFIPERFVDMLSVRIREILGQ